MGRKEECNNAWEEVIFCFYCLPIHTICSVLQLRGSLWDVPVCTVTVHWLSYIKLQRISISQVAVLFFLLFLVLKAHYDKILGIFRGYGECEVRLLISFKSVWQVSREGVSLPHPSCSSLSPPLLPGDAILSRNSWTWPEESGFPGDEQGRQKEKLKSQTQEENSTANMSGWLLRRAVSKPQPNRRWEKKSPFPKVWERSMWWLRKSPSCWIWNQDWMWRLALLRRSGLGRSSNSLPSSTSILSFLGFRSMFF